MGRISEEAPPFSSIPHIIVVFLAVPCEPILLFATRFDFLLLSSYNSNGEYDVKRNMFEHILNNVWKPIKNATFCLEMKILRNVILNKCTCISMLKCFLVIIIVICNKSNKSCLCKCHEGFSMWFKPYVWKHNFSLHAELVPLTAVGVQTAQSFLTESKAAASLLFISPSDAHQLAGTSKDFISTLFHSTGY